MRKVIVNSTPLIVLFGIGYLDILQKLYQEIIIPSAVYQEVTAVDDHTCIQAMTENTWIHVESIQDDTEKKMYKAKLHAGEDAAKKTAKYLGLTVTGTLGVLLKAKHQGIIESVRPLMTQMKRNGFYINSQLESMVLEQAGENTPHKEHP